MIVINDIFHVSLSYYKKKLSQTTNEDFVVELENIFNNFLNDFENESR